MAAKGKSGKTRKSRMGKQKTNVNANVNKP